MPTKPTVYAAVGDVGSAQYLLPVLPQLQQSYNLKILVDAKGAAKGLLEKESIDHVVVIDNIGPLEGSLVLCGTAGKAQSLWKAATKAAKAAGTPVVWFGDFFGSGLEPAAQDLTPDHFFAFDGSTAQQFVALRPESSGKVHIIGNPSFDVLAKLNLAGMRQQAREMLGIDDSVKLVGYAASSLMQFDLEAESLGTLLPWLKGHPEWRFGINFHPADRDKCGPEIERIEKNLRGVLGSRLVDLSKLSGAALAATVDLFVTDYSTEGVRSALLGVPTVFIMLESAQKYQRSRGNTHPHFFPILDNRTEATPAFVIYKSDDVGCFDQAVSPSGRGWARKALTQARFKTLCDGQAGRRFLGTLEYLLKY